MSLPVINLGMEYRPLRVNFKGNFAAPKPAESTEEAPAQKSFYKDKIPYPYNYKAKITRTEPKKEDREYLEARLELALNAIELARVTGRVALVNKIIEDDGRISPHFDSASVVHIAANTLFSEELLNEIIDEAKSEKDGADRFLSCRNFSEDPKTLRLILAENFEDKTEDGEKIIIHKTKTYSKDGLVSSSEDAFEGPFMYSVLNGGKDYTVTKFQDDEIEKLNRPLEYSLKVIHTKEGAPKGAYYKTPSPDMKGAFCEYYYDLKDTGDENLLELIQTGRIKPARAISYVKKQENGDITYFQNYKTSGTSLRRTFTKMKKGGFKQSYALKDGEGNLIFATTRSHYKNSENSAVTIIDGQRYDISYNDRKREITVSNGDRQRVINFFDKTAKIRNYYQNVLNLPKEATDGILRLDEFKEEVQHQTNTKEEQKALYEAAKNLPADLLLELDNGVFWWRYEDERPAFMHTCMFAPNRTSTIAHELGHGVDKGKKLSEKESLAKIFEKEKLAYEKISTSGERNPASYFFNIFYTYDEMEEGRPTGGICEVFAEVNSLLSSPGQDESHLSIRTQILTEHFPKTTAYIMKAYKNELLKL